MQAYKFQSQGSQCANVQWILSFFCTSPLDTTGGQKMIKQLGYLLSLIILRIIPLPLPGQPPHNSHSAAYKGENAVSINTALLILFTFQGERVHSEENICY